MMKKTFLISCIFHLLTVGLLANTVMSSNPLPSTKSPAQIIEVSFISEPTPQPASQQTISKPVSKSEKQSVLKKATVKPVKKIVKKPLPKPVIKKTVQKPQKQIAKPVIKKAQAYKPIKKRHQPNILTSKASGHHGKDQTQIAQKTKTSITSETKSPSVHGTLSKSQQKNILSSYIRQVKIKAQQQKRYPRMARMRGTQGTTVVALGLNQVGNLLSTHLLESSGSKILDKEAIAAIKRAAPYPPIPKELNKNSMQIKMAFVFKMN